jgi:alditol oxidase
VAETNWAGTHTYRARAIHRPATMDELRWIVAAAPRIRVLGSRHSFTDVADSDELVSLDALPADVVLAPDRATVAAGGAVRYGELAAMLEAEGLALHNLASLPHISIAGAVATATHGSGDRSGNLATAVAALELVTSTGDVVRARRGEPDFDGMVVSLGALGAVTRVELDVEPDYDVRQRVFEGLPWGALHEHFDAVTAAGESVSVFTRWEPAAADQVWVKSRVDPPHPEEVRADLLGAPAATVERHPILGLDPVNCTPQLGAPGRWSDRLPHFRMGFTPSAGEEIQSEYVLARRDASAAIDAVRALGARIAPVLQVSEIRTIPADRLWLSPQHGQDTVAIHFTWTREPAGVARAIDAVEAALEPYEPRPHWGKVFHLGAATIAGRYERLEDFRALAGRLDPRGAFRNAWLERHALGPG